MHDPVAYFSMEIALESKMPTYSGGLGVLAGDTLKAAADLSKPVMGISLLYRKGYFHQHVDALGIQTESPCAWELEKFLKKENFELRVTIENQAVILNCWRYDIRGASGGVVPVYFLDTEHPQNSEYHRSLTDYLYGGDDRYRLCQETVLGFGGIELITKLSNNLESYTFHMNEGHAALLTIAALQQRDKDWVKQHCVFTTHTPVKAGHDRFSRDLAERILGKETLQLIQTVTASASDQLNMTELALSSSRFTNGVAKKHGEVSRKLFPGHKITAITNGVHAGTWVAAPMAKLFDEQLKDWRQDNQFLRYIMDVPAEAVSKAHQQAKLNLIDTIRSQTQVAWQPDIFTIGFARRSTSYKRSDLILQDLDRLEAIARQAKGLQIVFAGKSHPKDLDGKKLIERIVTARNKLQSNSSLSIVYLENYDMDMALNIVAGVDAWLNNPIKPLEASGTSGMKAALNGVPSISTLDGWWIEGHVEGVTGWEIIDHEDGLKARTDAGEKKQDTSRNLYSLLESKILPLYLNQRGEYDRIRRNCIALNGSHFNTQRMFEQYEKHAYIGSK